MHLGKKIFVSVYFYIFMLSPTLLMGQKSEHPFWEYTKIASQIEEMMFEHKVGTYSISVADVIEQYEKHGSELSFNEVLDRVFFLLVNDENHPESPLNLLATAEEDLIQRQEIIKGLLKDSRSFFALVSPHLVDGESSLRKIYLPENGESVDAFWIFYFSLPALSDHLFWVIVSRKNTDSYVYGFN
ncbi:MAG: hypothetical protein KA436_06535 [Oligoflexales bacterium]|nr:hypothetical protein [Oligoflexales bacterium]